ncbi:LysR family transcriptional regulator [Spiractinospora alimapuensis]|uniref:LysR family transcriptional regulator n=1 Tax=Spiractinospora alimapuensis TaxID=2820884 RepID=UPI001F1C3565|nr:LysR family transcriptional regulator [Spiractinospora alimapuensis]QVQ51954.1 LysR family transcriptional regulator [Spiractinospora alimapuensis]
MIDARLQLLIAVSEYKTVTAAAEALYRSPSGVSKQLKELAAELDIDLLERQGRRVRLTPAGQRLVNHARALNAQWETALSDTAAAARQLCGPVTIGSFPTGISSLVTPTVSQLRTRHGSLRPLVVETYSREVLVALESGAIDVGLFVAEEATSRIEDSHIDVCDLMDDPIDLLIPHDHPFNDRERVALVDAAHEEWITGQSHQDSYAELLAATRAVGYSPRVAHYAQELTAVTALVAAGLGIAAVPRIAMTISHPNVNQIALAGRDVPRRRILLAMRRGSAENPRIEAVVAALRERIADLRRDQ